MFSFIGNYDVTWVVISMIEKFETPRDFEPVLVQLSDEEERLHEELLKKINKPIWN